MLFLIRPPAFRTMIASINQSQKGCVKEDSDLGSPHPLSGCQGSSQPGREDRYKKLFGMSVMPGKIGTWVPIHIMYGGSGPVSSEKYGAGLCSVSEYFLETCQHLKLNESKEGDVPVLLKYVIPGCHCDEVSKLRSVD